MKEYSTPKEQIDHNMQLVNDCERCHERMDPWQTGFVESIRWRMEDGRLLTKRQEETLNDIWVKVT